jgi:uncharacterized protein YjiS (DUF1127 family)
LANLLDISAERFRAHSAIRLAAAINWLLDPWRREALIQDLSRLNDHCLRDIGIERGEIESLARTMVKRSHGH